MANDLIKYGAIAVGGYFVLKYFGIDLLHMGGPVPVAITNTQAANASMTTASPQVAASQMTTLQKLQKAVIDSNSDPNSYQSSDFWGYYYAQARGIAAAAPEELFPGVDRNKLYSLAEWWSAMVGKGFSGLGVIANHVNPYWFRPTNVMLGQNINPTGMERYIFSVGG
jgi:hypothetical protein